MILDRRHFLRASCASLGLASGLATNLAAFNAYAADTDGYKALVCVFFYGAMDCHDTILPYDQTSYNQYEAIREPLLAGYDSSQSRRRGALLGLSGDIGGRNFALPSEFGGLHDLYEQGKVAVVGNIGPLTEPITRTTYQSGAGRRPARLFSHNDQQSTWMASQPEGASSGWGGRFSDIMQAASANSNAAFTSMGINSAPIFLTGLSSSGFVTSSSGAAALSGANNNSTLGAQGYNTQYLNAIRANMINPTSLFGKDVKAIANASLDNNALLDEQLSVSDNIMTSFPSENSLAQQLQMVAKLIARRDSFGMKRQIFFVSMGGFDTHSNQAEDMPVLQARINDSLKAFYDTTVELGIENDVTTFTASDFGRTLGVNGDGTDHGWGGHHFVMGGSVNGGQILGDIPPPEFNHQYDVGRGRLIPSTSVDQYAYALGDWFGLSDSELREVLPGISNFDTARLASLFT